MAKLKSKIIFKDYMVYIISFVVIVISVCLVLSLPVSDSIKAYFSLPGFAGLFSLLVQGWRDQVAYERSQELQEKQHEFDLAVASHMANVVFDKQVEFCEQYSQKLYNYIPKMFQEGPSTEALSCAIDLQNIRLKFSPWISLEVVHNLTPYEEALREIGALKMAEESSRTQSGGITDTGIRERMFKVFMRFLGLSTEAQKDTQTAIDSILVHLKDVLDVTDLENLRHRAIKTAIQEKK
jgi:hypothetical protein